MAPPDLPTLTTLGLDQIDISDRTFAITPDWFPVDALAAAIRRVGLLCPLHVEPLGSERYRVISGFRRLKAASSLGLDRFHCLVRGGDPGQLFVEALLENASIRSLHLLEKANAVWKLTRLFRIAHGQVIGEFLPALGVKPNRFEMNRLLEVSQLPRLLQEMIALDAVQPDIALGAARWTSDEQAALIRAVRTLRPGFNRQKELFFLLDELRGRDQESVVGMLSALPGKVDELLDDLRSRRFPKFAEYEKLYHEKKTRLRLPPEIQFRLPPYFEGERIQVGFAVRSPEELRSLAERLLEVADKPELAEIFGML